MGDRDDIIAQKFDEWTGGLTPEESRIRIFEKVRNIPFAIIPEFFSFKKGPAGMLIQNRGFCVPKHYLMGEMFQQLGFDVKYCIYAFKWHALDVDYSARLKELAEKLPVTYHLACKVFIEGQWSSVDATWDPVLKKAGFPVNEEWDGKSNTAIAVKPLEEFVLKDVYEMEETFRRVRSYNLSERLQLSRFSDSLNRWLEQIRLR